MGLISDLALFPITGPIKGLLFIFKQIKERVDAEQLDETRVEEELVTLSLRREFGEISDAYYLEQEDLLLKRFDAIRAYKEIGETESGEGS